MIHEHCYKLMSVLSTITIPKHFGSKFILTLKKLKITKNNITIRSKAPR